MKNISAKSFRKLTASFTACSNSTKAFSLFAISFLISIAASSQTLREKLYGGQVKADTGTVLVSNDTSKYVIQQNETISATVPGEKRNNNAVIASGNEAMPDSLNKLYYSKQKLWKRFIENNTNIINDQVNDNRKVKKGTYNVEIEYEIGLNGRITTRSVTVEPNNPYILDHFNELMKRTPVLSPPIYADGKPRVSVARQPVTIVKK